eukprot:SAG11_NODE_2323_length_3523_cov_5.707652_1_plen_96_part_00
MPGTHFPTAQVQHAKRQSTSGVQWHRVQRNQRELFGSLAIVVLSGCFLSYLVESLYSFVFPSALHSLVILVVIWFCGLSGAGPTFAKSRQTSPEI